MDVEAELAKRRALRSSEAILKPGERVFVLGVARQDEVGRTVVSGKGAFPFLVSLRPESEVRKGAALAGVMGILFGAASAVGGVHAVRTAWRALGIRGPTGLRRPPPDPPRRPAPSRQRLCTLRRHPRPTPMAKDKKNTGFQQSAGLIRYFDAEEETAIHINPKFVVVAAFGTAIAVLGLSVFLPLR